MPMYVIGRSLVKPHLSKIKFQQFDDVAAFGNKVSKKELWELLMEI